MIYFLYVSNGGEMEKYKVEDGYFIYGLIFTLANRIQTLGDKRFEDITMKQHFLMIALSMNHGESILKDVADLIGCSYQNIRVMANSLVKSGYLNLIKDKEDRRKLILKSTGKFEKLAEDSLDITKEFMGNLYSNISKEDLKITLKTLIKMNENLGGKL